MVGETLELELNAHADREKGIQEPLTATLRVVRVEGEGPLFAIAGQLLNVTLV